MRTLADIEAAEIHSNCQGNAFFQPARDSLHETPRSLAQNWEDGCRGGNDRAIIRQPRPLLAEIAGPREANCIYKNQ
jgi:hypothetical protein